MFAYSADGVTGTAYPESCQQEQSSTEVQYGGQKFVFDPYGESFIHFSEYYKIPHILLLQKGFLNRFVR